MNLLLFEGGSSIEREVSYKSSKNMKALFEEMGHSVSVIDVQQDGSFLYESKEVSIVPNKGFFVEGNKIEADIALPMIHGHGGEDGSLQGVFEIVNIPYLSDDVLTSSICMHKAAASALFKAYEIEATAGIVLMTNVDHDNRNLGAMILSFMGYDLVLKPEAGGSSIGVMIIKNPTVDKLREAIKEMRKYDTKAILQPYYKKAKEIEVGVVYNSENKCYIDVGAVQIETNAEFLDYESKYSSKSHILKEDEIKIKPNILRNIRKTALAAADAVGVRMYARVDFLVNGKDYYVNEINTIPGMTETSHFPALVGDRENLKRVFNILINNALARNKAENNLLRTL